MVVCGEVIPGFRGMPPPRPISAQERFVLADALGDTPETVISVHLLRRGLARAVVAGDPARPLAAIVQAHDLPGEPVGFGDDGGALWALLRRLEGWMCVNVAHACAAPLSELMAETLGANVRRFDDVYHTLTRPVIPFRDATVRRLTPADLALVEAAPSEVRGGGYGNINTMLAEGIAAGAIIDGRLVAIACTFARTERHADLGVTTLAPWRGRGFATAAASLVAAALQREEITPVWSVGQHNAASLRVATKLGFAEIGRRVYVIPEHVSGAAVP